MERWAYQTNLEIQKSLDDSLVASVRMDDVSLGTLTMTFDATDGIQIFS